MAFLREKDDCYVNGETTEMLPKSLYKVGDRVEAEYYNGKRYLGKVMQVKARKSKKTIKYKYFVFFDDGYSRDDVREHELRHEHVDCLRR